MKRDELLTGLTHIDVAPESLACSGCHYKQSCKNDTCVYLKCACSTILGLEVEASEKDGDICVLQEWVKQLGGVISE